MTMTETQISTAPATIAESRENVTNDDAVTVTESMLGIGECHAQGDLMFVRLGGLPKGSKPRDNRQLAEGTTQGSRHICEVGEVYDCDAAMVAKLINVNARYVGPIIRTVDGRADVTHPEHGDHFYRGDMVLACVFQRSLDAEEQEQRVRD